MAMRTITELSTGGYACTLLDNDPTATHSEQVVRVTLDTGSKYAKLQRAMSIVLEGLTPHTETIYSSTYDALDPEYRRAFDAFIECRDKVRVWKELVRGDARNPDWHQAALWVTHMDYAYMGNLAHFVHRQPRNVSERTYRRMLLLLLVAAYVGQLRAGFDHNDLSYGNIAVTWDARFSIYVPQLIDYDFGTLWLLEPGDEYGRRAVGTFYARAPEFNAAGAVAAAQRSVRGANDVWAYGMIFLMRELRKDPILRASGNWYHPWGIVGKALGEEFTHEAQQRVAEYHCTCGIHALLNHAGDVGAAHAAYEDDYAPPIVERHVYDWHAAQGKRLKMAIWMPLEMTYGDALSALDDDARALFKRMLHLDARERTWGGDLHRYWNMRYFTSMLPVRLWLSRFMVPLLRGGERGDENVGEGPTIKTK